MNPFDDETSTFKVVVNAEGQHALWPDFAAVPPGWTVAHGSASRTDCLAYVRAHWVDLRPRSLVAHMEG